MGQLEDFERQTDERFQQLLRGARKKAAEDAAQLELKIQGLWTRLHEAAAESARQAAQLGAVKGDVLREIDREARRIEARVINRIDDLDRRIADAIGVAAALEIRATQIAAKQSRTAEDLAQIEADQPYLGSVLTDADIVELRRQRGTA